MEQILTFKPTVEPKWWSRFIVTIPDDVKRRLAVAKAAHGIANQLAPLEPEANRAILYQVAEILGVLKDEEVRTQ